MKIRPSKKILAVIFDLDGVLVSTDKLHLQAWKKIAKKLKIPFSKKNSDKLRGISRADSLEIILSTSSKKYSSEEKNSISKKKNCYFKKLIRQLTKKNILPGVLKLIKELKKNNIKIAVASSSKNAKKILKSINLLNEFDKIVDGNKIKRSKPNPEIFLLTASLLSVKPKNCLIVEDSMAGVEAALAAGMKVLAVGAAQSHRKATIKRKSLSGIRLNNLYL